MRLISLSMAVLALGGCGWASAEEGPDAMVFFSCLYNEDSELPGHENHYAIQNDRIYAVRDDGTLIDQCEPNENVKPYCYLTDREAKWGKTWYKNGETFSVSTASINRFTLAFSREIVAAGLRVKYDGKCEIIDAPIVERKF